MAAGRKTGGRKEGTPNKSTLARQSAPGAPDPDFMTSLKEPARFPAYKLARVDALVPYDRNPRTHTPAQVDKIAASVREFGFTNPVLVDGRRGVVAGHGRLLAAKALGMDVVPTIELSHLTAAQRRAYVLADNRLAEDAGWDMDLLASELGELSDIGFDLSLTGFTERELVSFMAGAGGNTDPDDVPEPEAVAVSRLGDVWSLGVHRLVCGDCTSPEVVESVLQGAKPHLMVTDPPYGVEYDADWRNQYQEAVGEKPTYKRSVGKVENDDRADWSEAWALFEGDVAYVWHAGVHSPEVAASLVAHGFTPRALIVWAKQKHSFGRGHYHHQHEPLWYMVRKSATGHWQGDRTQTTVWPIDRNSLNETGHSTQKPVECMKRPIENNSAPGDSIYEPFSGSGTTIIAAEMTGRGCHAIEIEPRYVDVAIRRWQAFTGLEAQLSTGQAFAEISVERAPTEAEERPTSPPAPRPRRAPSSRLSEAASPVPEDHPALA